MMILDWKKNVSSKGVKKEKDSFINTMSNPFLSISGREGGPFFKGETAPPHPQFLRGYNSTSSDMAHGGGGVLNLKF